MMMYKIQRWGDLSKHHPVQYVFWLYDVGEGIVHERTQQQAASI